MPVRIVFFDCDGTLTKVKSSWEYLHRRLNIWDNNADEYQRLFREGKIDYNEFCERDALLWSGIKLSKIMEIIEEIPYHEGSRELIAALKEKNIYTAIISTGLSLLVNKAKEDLGVDISFSNDLLADDGLLTGRTKINVQYNKKGVLVRRLLNDTGIGREEACAVGDGEGDMDMFESVGLPIGFCSQTDSCNMPKHAVSSGSLVDVLDIIGRHP